MIISWIQWGDTWADGDGNFNHIFTKTSLNWKTWGREICLLLVIFVYLWLPLVTFGYYWLPFMALYSLSKPYLALLGLTGPYWALLGHTGTYWALLGCLTWPYWTLRGLTLHLHTNSLTDWLTNGHYDILGCFCSQKKTLLS